MSQFVRHVILITDGQVSDSERVIALIREMKERNNAFTHTVGIGNGVSFDMIRRGAAAGGGEHTFIKDDSNMSKQIIHLLEGITLP